MTPVSELSMFYIYYKTFNIINEIFLKKNKYNKTERSRNWTGLRLMCFILEKNFIFTGCYWSLGVILKFCVRRQRLY